MLMILCTLVLALLTQVADCQFLYPVDPNPPQNPLTFECYVCKSDDEPNCMTVTNTTNTQSCTGIRLGCWIIVDMETMVYERTCVQPDSIRQGVYCNRLMENREFCYYVDDPSRGRVRKCSKCCLNDRCNGGRLTGDPDDEFQTCVSCNGNTEPQCNSQLSSDVPTYLTEQCLMPNSDCWTQKVITDGSEVHISGFQIVQNISSHISNVITRTQEVITDGSEVYIRGCQIALCDDSNVQETCSAGENRITCSQCCRDANRCNRELLRGIGNQLLPSVLQMILLQSLVIMCM